MEMDFKQSIKMLHKEFFNTTKKGYNTNSIILKMITEKGLLPSVYDCDLAFKTCQVYRFSDKYISKVYTKSIERAVELMRSRAVCCMSAIVEINDIMAKNFAHESKANIRKQLNIIKNRLYDLAIKSINTSNAWAKHINQPEFNLKDTRFKEDEILNNH